MDGAGAGEPGGAEGSRDRRPWGIALEATAVVAGLLVVLVAWNLLLLAQTASVVRSYDAVLAGPMSQADQARRLGVGYDQELLAWRDLLLAGSDPGEVAGAAARVRDRSLAVRELISQLVRDVDDPGARRELARFAQAHAELDAVLDPAVSAAAAGDVRAAPRADAAVRRVAPPTGGPGLVADLLRERASERVAAGTADLARRQQLISLLGSAGFVVLLVLLAVVVVQVVRPVRRLTEAARAVADRALPEAAARIAALPQGAIPPRLPPLRVRTDELAGLAEAVTAVQDSAVRLLVEQHRRAGEDAEALLRLGRDDSTVVLPDRDDRAGPGVPVSEVLRTALAEVGDSGRLDLHHVEEVAVADRVVPDLTGVLAELVRDAVRRSPSTGRVVVLGQRAGRAYRVRVVDHGAVPARDQVAAHRGPGGPAPDGGRGTVPDAVVRSAARSGIDVRLETTAGPGTTATVVVPPGALVDPAGTPPSRRPGPRVVDVRDL